MSSGAFPGSLRHFLAQLDELRSGDILDIDQVGRVLVELAADEEICSDYGDHPELDYSELPRELRRVRGPCRIADGVAAYVPHVGLHRQQARATCMGRGRTLADRR